MEAMEYAGYQLVRGCGCRNGFCGACATIYRIAGDRQLRTCLACSTKVENNMYVATLPFFPLVKAVYDVEKVKPTEQIMMQLYRNLRLRGLQRLHEGLSPGPERHAVHCLRTAGVSTKCAEESFDCVMCGLCSSRCPAGISHPQVAMLARRLNGKYLAPHCDHLDARIQGDQRGQVRSAAGSPDG